jgi:hypothetical protein
MIASAFMANAQSKATVPTVFAAACIVIGVFGPLVKVGADVEFLGDVSTSPTVYGLMQTKALILIAIAVIAVLMAVRGMGKWLWACAAGVWLTLLWDMIRGWMTPKDESAFGQITDAISSEVSKAVGEQLGGLIFDFTSLSWGGFMFLAGCLGIIWAAIKGR